LTEEFWDCECATDYIHPKTASKCSKCGAVREDQPDSRVNEVEVAGLTAKKVV
jgi:hypothetical protein